MSCPKCGAEADVGAVECASCGVLFAKMRDREERHGLELVEAANSAEPDVEVAESGSERVWVLLFPEPAPIQMPALVARAVFLLILAIWGFSFVLAGPRSPALGGSFLHLIHLVFHEAGHVIFMPFGRFLTVLGGPLFQLVVPLVFAVYFVRWREDVFAASVCTAWAGHSLMDLAPYVSDARALDLVLLGGRTGKEVEGHDFEYLLGATGLLRWDITLGRLVFVVGCLVALAALGWGASQLRRRYLTPHARS